MISSVIRARKNIVLITAGTLFAILIGFGISAQTQLFSDDFQDGNADGWTKSSGTWAVVTDGSLAYRQSGTSADSNARNGSASWTNISVQARVKPIAFNGADRYVGVMTRVVSASRGTVKPAFLATRSTQSTLAVTDMSLKPSRLIW